MISTAADFYQEAQKALALVNQFSEQQALPGLAVPDHLGYKCRSSSTYLALQDILGREAQWLYQSFISGRRISIIRTQQSILSFLGPINLIELSDQKPDGRQVDGFDHIELYPTIGYDELLSILIKRKLPFHEVARPHHTTHDLRLADGFLIRLTRERLADKIRGEMR